MQTFEYYFNPKKKDDVLFDSFCFEPEEGAEKPLGNLYIISQLSNALPSSKIFIKDLVEAIKSEYYSGNYNHCSCALKGALAKANEFLNERQKEGDFSWQGNLDFAVLAIDGMMINFVKIGSLEIYMMRCDEIFNISDNLEYQDTTPGVFFSNVATGKLSPDDKLVIVTKEVCLNKKKEEFLQILLSLEKWDKKNTSAAVKQFPEIKLCNGIILMVDMHEEEQGKFLPSFSFSLPKISLSLPKISIPKISLFSQINKKIKATENLKSEGEKPMESENATLPRQPMLKFNSKWVWIIFLILIIASIAALSFKFRLFATAPKSPTIIQTVPETKTESGKETVVETKNQTPLPAPLVELKQQEFSAEKIIALGDYIYLYAPGKPNLYQVHTATKQTETIKTALALRAAVENSDAIFIWDIAGDIYKYNPTSKKMEKIQSLTFANNPEIIDFRFYQGKFYLLDKSDRTILKALPSATTDWISKVHPRPSDPKSIAIDQNIWVLNSENEALRYYKSAYMDKLILNANPSLHNPQKIWTSIFNQFLYVSEPSQNRILIYEKTGKFVKQYINTKLNAIKDIAVSAGKKLYILNGSEVYEISETL